MRGLRSVARDDRPPVAVVHVAFQTMVGLGSLLAVIALACLFTAWRRMDFARTRWLLVALTIATPFGFIATEAGWIVTEVGRQPWIVQGLLRTRDAVTPMPGLVVPMLLFTLLYAVLGIVVIALVGTMVHETRELPEPAGES